MVTTESIQPRTLGYASRPAGGAVAWERKLGVASAALGAVGVAVGALQLRQAWTYAYDPTFRFLYPPTAWVPHAYLALVAAGVAVSVYLIAAGVGSLVVPRLAARLHWAYVLVKVPLAVATAVAREALFWNHPDVPASMSAVNIAVTSGVFCLYPLFVAVALLRARMLGATTAD